MIFSTAFLASILCSATALTTESTPDVTLHAKSIKELKSKLREKLDTPTSLTSKMTKFGKFNLKPSTVNLEMTSFDETPSHLRGLKMKDNFFSWTSYEDDQCTTPAEQYGTLVNYCMNERGELNGVKRSYITKVNKKENVVVEIQYDGYDCKVCSSPLFTCF
jgi:hypothetical protein